MMWQKNEEKDQKKPEPVNSDNDHYLFLSFFETVALAPQVLSNQFAEILISFTSENNFKTH